MLHTIHYTIPYSCYISYVCIFFDDNGNMQPDFTDRINSMFIFAAESNPLLEGLIFTLHQFDLLKSTSLIKDYSKCGWNKCSSTCEFLYFIDNCGGATVNNICT